MADRSYQLVVRKGPRPGQVFPLTLDTVTVGRDPLADIVINDPEVSRHHAQFIQTSGGYELKDLGSTNGSFVDGRRITGETVPLAPGQVVMFGSNVTLIFQATSAADPLATMVAPMGGTPSSTPPPEPPNREPDSPEFEPGDRTVFDEPPPTTPLPQVPMPEPEDEPEPVKAEPLPPFEPVGPPTETRSPKSERQEPERWESERSEDLPSTQVPESEPLIEAPLPDERSHQVPPPHQPPPDKRGGPGGLSQRNLIIAIVVAMLLCCCCLLIAAVVSAQNIDLDSLFSAAQTVTGMELL